MRFLLLYPPRPASTNTVPPVGLLSIGAVLEDLGHEVRLIDSALSGLRGKALASRIHSYSPDMLLVSAFSSDVAVLTRELPLLKEALGDTPLLLGGPHASCRGVKTLDDLPQINTIFLGEAEESIVEFLADPSSRIPGVISRIDPWDTSPRHVKDLSVLPIPAWHLAPPANYTGLPNGVLYRRMPFAPIITTRGCPYHCTFCAGYRITGRNIRHRPLSVVGEAIELLVNSFGAKEIHIEDDNFTFDDDYATQFCLEAIRRQYPVFYSTPNGVRLDSLNDHLLELMKRAGWYVIHCGIESGSDRILRSVRKNLSTSEIRTKIALINRVGLSTAGYFILGLPGETVDDMNKTINFSLSSGLAWAHFASFLPIPGSEAGDRWFSDHPDSEGIWDVFHNTRCPAPPDGVSRKTLGRLQRKAFLRFYLRSGPMLRLLKQILNPVTFRHHLRRFKNYLHAGNTWPRVKSGTGTHL
ncbi:MAG: B12-binding domain-containing radical SAM protein [Candidatus Aegiribacteria sp.]|nr:B12-binding domain-containing radical SAM protein [Candidatus Aegiribacteria sp.]